MRLISRSIRDQLADVRESADIAHNLTHVTAELDCDMGWLCYRRAAGDSTLHVIGVAPVFDWDADVVGLDDPLVARSRSSQCAYAWGQQDYVLAGARAMPIYEHSAAHGIRGGLDASVHALDGRKLLVSLSSSIDPLASDHQSTAKVSVIRDVAAMLAGVAIPMLDKATFYKETLSQHELEYLKWTFHGLDAHAIAGRMPLVNTRSVIRTLDGASKKMGFGGYSDVLSAAFAAASCGVLGPV